jgi:hypothetical protein
VVFFSVVLSAAAEVFFTSVEVSTAAAKFLVAFEVALLSGIGLKAG